MRQEWHAAAEEVHGDDAAATVTVGRLVHVTADGHPFVDFPGNPGDPVEARSAVAAPAGSAPADCVNLPVLLVFEGGDLDLPVIVGFVRDTLFAPAPAPAATAEIDGKRIVLDGEQEIVLRCGQSSITLRRDGKIVLLGTNIVSRASEVNKIKGGNVAIN